jgi:4-amino-4-deoxy-L-arabinose transferase-like glycosyltransferase
MAEREWREATDMKPAVLWLVVVLVVAAGLRFLHLGHGIPFALGIDEPEIMTRVVRMMKTGDLNPHFFHYPGLLFYVHLAVACGRFIVGAASGAFPSLDVVDQVDFFLWARAVTVLFGVGTVFIVHQIGLRWGARHGLLAAGLMAVMPMHVRESHYVLTDVPVTCFTTLAFLLSLVAHERTTAKAFLWAGVAAGLAMATKYTAGMAILLPLVAAWMTLNAKPSRVLCVVAALGGWVGAFLLAAPYTLLDLPAFLNGFAHLMTSYGERSYADPPAIIYLKHLRLNFGWPATILMLSGLVLGVVRSVKGPGRVRWTLLVVFPVLFFYALSRQGLVYARYLLPAIPFACILAAIAVISGVSLLRRFNIPRAPRTALITALTVAALLPPAVTAVGFVRTIGRTSTQAQAYAWLLEHVPQGSRVVIERFEVRLSEARYNPAYVTSLTEKTYDDYKRDGAKYLVATSQVYGPVMQAPQDARDAYDRYQAMFMMGKEVARFTPAPDRPGPEVIVLEVR